MFRLTIYFLFMLFSLLPFRLLAQSGSGPYALLLKSLYKKTVPLVQPALLSAEIEQGAPLLLLDTRSEKEYRVSHLQGARFLSYDHFSAEAMAAIPKNREIVVYCSVGYRSERIGEKLQELGFTNVRNLYGGIFAWANEGNPVYEGQKKTNRVHAYSRTWGVWLKNAEKVYD